MPVRKPKTPRPRRLPPSAQEPAPPPSPSPRGETGCVLVLTTVGGLARAGEIAETLVGEELAACVNLVPGVRSVYRWKGEICRDEEVLLLVKTTRGLFGSLERRIRAIHPYECPEIVALPLEAGHEPYLRWLAESVREPVYRLPEE